MNQIKKLGNLGEEKIANFLEEKKFKILIKNYKSKFGEIDLIAKKENIIAFIEVKTRTTKYFPISTVVTLSKQKKIIKTAKLYIIKNNIIDKIFRFDIATIIQNKNQFDIEYIENAFYGK